MKICATPPRPPAFPPAAKPAPPGASAEALYDYFLAQEEGCNPDHLAFLDRGIDQSFLKDQIAAYPARLRTIRPEPSTLGTPYPALGQLPAIDNQALNFLHPDISHACVCVGSWKDGQLQARWAGRQATQSAQMWSATKTFPMLRTVIRAGDANLEKSHVRSADGSQSIPVTDAFDAIVSYRQGGSASNRLARMFKHFDTPDGLEGWLKGVTGNSGLTFRGGYGEPATIAQPLLKEGTKTLLSSPGVEHRGANLVSAYDLCRVMAGMGWQSHLPASSALAGLSTAGADTLTRALGTDSARFVDVAWEALGLQDRIQDPVVISKLGFGLSDERQQWEEVYSAFVQWTDNQTQKQHQLAVALKGFKPPQNEKAAVELDARMATEVTRIVQRVVDGKL